MNLTWSLVSWRGKGAGAAALVANASSLLQAASSIGRDTVILPSAVLNLGASPFVFRLTAVNFLGASSSARVVVRKVNRDPPK